MIHVGVRGGKHHASVDDLGRIELTNGSPVLDWHVADEKRWHSAGDPTGMSPRGSATRSVDRCPRGRAMLPSGRSMPGIGWFGTGREVMRSPRVRATATDAGESFSNSTTTSPPWSATAQTR